MFWQTGYGDEFAKAFVDLAGGDTTVAMVAMLTFFGAAHSGLAGLRQKCVFPPSSRSDPTPPRGSTKTWGLGISSLSLPLLVQYSGFSRPLRMTTEDR